MYMCIVCVCGAHLLRARCACAHMCIFVLLYISRLICTCVLCVCVVRARWEQGVRVHSVYVCIVIYI